jgi:apolipoprotein D and lipocalin family protein
MNHSTSPRLAGITFIASLVSAPAALADTAPKTATPVSVASVDIARYAGLWYEIARYPSWFQRNCQGVTALYTPRPDGRITVLNTCRTGARDGRPRAVRGVARVIPGSNGARLAVNFAPVPLPAGRGNYWILSLDDAYTQAVVGDPSGRYLWFLSRTPRVSAEVRAQMNAVAVRNGYDLSKLEEGVHP